MVPRWAKIEILEAPGVLGVSVAEVCRRYQISRQTFYSWRRTYEAKGSLGLERRSRRPPTSLDDRQEWIERLIVRLRSEQPDWGARRLHAQLVQRGVVDAPARSTIHAILCRHGLVEGGRGSALDDAGRSAHPGPDPRGRVLHPNRYGVVTYRARKIGIGSSYAGQPLSVIEEEGVVKVFAGPTLVREVVLGASGTYHGSGKPRGRAKAMVSLDTGGRGTNAAS